MTDPMIPVPMISVRGLWKVYGHRAERIVGSPLADLPRGDLLDLVIIDVIDAYLEPAPRERDGQGQAHVTAASHDANIVFE